MSDSDTDPDMPPLVVDEDHDVNALDHDVNALHSHLFRALALNANGKGTGKPQDIEGVALNANGKGQGKGKDINGVGKNGGKGTAQTGQGVGPASKGTGQIGQGVGPASKGAGEHGSTRTIGDPRWRRQDAFAKELKTVPDMLERGEGMVAIGGSLSHGHLNYILGGKKGCECPEGTTKCVIMPEFSDFGRKGQLHLGEGGSS